MTRMISAEDGTLQRLNPTCIPCTTHARSPQSMTFRSWHGSGIHEVREKKKAGVYLDAATASNKKEFLMFNSLSIGAADFCSSFRTDVVIATGRWVQNPKRSSREASDIYRKYHRAPADTAAIIVLSGPITLTSFHYLQRKRCRVTACTEGFSMIGLCCIRHNVAL